MGVNQSAPSAAPMPPVPIEEAQELEPQPFPIVSACMLVVIGVIFAAMLRVGQGDVTRAAYLFGDKENALIQAGQWWRLVTPIFLHGGWGHIVANGLTLLMLGVPMERIYGPRKFFLIYMLSGIAGNLLSFKFSPASSLGASGALYGLMGAGLVFPLRYANRIDPRTRREFLSQLARAAVINIGINFLPGLNLDRCAHFGGLAGGGLAALLWMPDALEEEAPSRIYDTVLWSATIAMLWLIGWAGWSQWRIARIVPPETQTYYAMEADNPWWGLMLPRDWRQLDTVNTDGVTWSGPHQSRLQIVDNRDIPELAQITRRMLESHHARFSPTTIDGKSGHKVVFTGLSAAAAADKTTDTAQAIDIPTQGQNRAAGTVVELYQIEDEGRVIVLLLSCPTSTYAQMQPVFNALLDGVRFVRPPMVAVPAAPQAPTNKG